MTELINEQIIDSFEINNRINLFLLDAIPEEHLIDIGATGGRNCGEQFAHIYNARLMWLTGFDKSMSERFSKISNESACTKSILIDGLNNSCEALINKFRLSLVSGAKLSGFKSHTPAFISYLIAHESHHRGQIMLTLKYNKHIPDKKVSYGIWEWGIR